MDERRREKENAREYVCVSVVVVRIPGERCNDDDEGWPNGGEGGGWREGKDSDRTWNFLTSSCRFRQRHQRRVIPISK